MGAAAEPTKAEGRPWSRRFSGSNFVWTRFEHALIGDIVRVFRRQVVFLWSAAVLPAVSEAMLARVWGCPTKGVPRKSLSCLMVLFVELPD